MVFYIACLIEKSKKATNRSIERKSAKIDECLDLVQIDIVRLINVKAYHREEYLV